MAEPKVVAEDIAIVLRRVVRPDDPNEGEAVQRLAERANTSTRTVYRALSPPETPPDKPHTISLDLADRLVIASGHHMAQVNPRLVLRPSGDVIRYTDPL